MQGGLKAAQGSVHGARRFFLSRGHGQGIGFSCRCRCTLRRWPTGRLRCHCKREGGFLGVVPVENTTEGTVYASLDAFSTAPQDIRILSEIRLPIVHMLATWQTSIDEVDEVHSHPQVLAQCRLWLTTNLPRAGQIPASSTSAAAASMKEQRGKAAICSSLAAEIHESSPRTAVNSDPVTYSPPRPRVEPCLLVVSLRPFPFVPVPPSLHGIPSCPCTDVRISTPH